MRSIQPREQVTLYAAQPTDAPAQPATSLLSQLLSQYNSKPQGASASTKPPGASPGSRSDLSSSPPSSSTPTRTLADFQQSEDLLETLQIWLGEDQVRRCAAAVDGAEWLKDAIDRDLATIQGLIETQLNAILHAPAFQKLEASWRGLDYLIRTKEKHATSQIFIKVLNCRWKELNKDLENLVEFDQSQLFKKIYEGGIGQAGENPFSAIVLDYSIHPRLDGKHAYDDMAILRGVAEVAAAAFCPVIANADPSLLGVDNFPDLKHTVDFDKVHTNLEFRAWQKFRSDPHSRFVALAMPRMLMRQPYEEVECHNFLFSEQVTKRDDYLWGGAAFAAGEVLLNSFAESGWFVNMRGATYGKEGGGLAFGPTQLCFRTEPLGNASRPMTDFIIDDLFEHKLASAGFLPLCSLKNTSLGAFYSSYTCQLPKEYNTIEASMSARLSSMLNYMLCASRFAHYLKRIARDKVGSYQTAEELETLLQNWINEYVSSDLEASTEARARKPLYEATIEISPIVGKAGEYRSTFFIVPHYELDDMRVTIELHADRLVTQTR